MALNGTKAFALAKKYTDDTVIGGGALKGKNCTITAITPVEGGNQITFEWTLDDGTVQTDDLYVINGVDGKDGKDGVDGKDGKDGKDGAAVVEVNPIIETGTKIADILVDGETYSIYSPSGGGSSELTQAITAAVAVGGIDIGTNYPIGTSLETILSDMLEPTLYPTFTAPSATLSATGTKLLEKGATLSTTFTASFNRGAITPAYGTDGYRAGVANGYSLNGGTSQSENTWSETVSESQTSYQASVSYDAGEQPKDSKGNDYQSPLPAGSVNTNTISYEFVNAIWANTVDISSIAKLSLVSKSAKQRDMQFPPQTVANPEVFDIPASWTVTAVQVKNDLSGAYEDASAQFTISNVTHDDAGGTSTNYKRYTFNMGFDTGSRTVRVKWS